METKAAIVLMFLCSSFLIPQNEAKTPSNPTKKFYDDMETRPILTYQCYHSGNSIDPPGSINYTILWDGTDSSTTEAIGTTWSAVAGMPNSYTRGSLSTHYDAASGVGKLTTSTVQEDLTVVEPFAGKALYLKIVLTSNNNAEVSKIYDVDYKCKNAKKLLAKVCPDPCNWELTREV
uniref:Putative secreted protein n=1 Tax=Ixodes ricinus TaxID=34613 RepID=V5H437_IXORI